MLQTFEALVDETGTIHLLEAAPILNARRALVTILEEGAPLEERPFGLCAGAFRVPDDFDAPLPEDILLAFEGHLDNP